MTLFSAVIAVLLLVSAVSGDPDITGENQEGSNAHHDVDVHGKKIPLSKKPFVDLIKITEENCKEAFESLDLNDDKLIKPDELEKFYFHKDSAFAVHKFIKMVDTDNPQHKGSIDFEEFKKFLEMGPLKRQILGVSSGQSLEFRYFYYRDEILSYVYLVLDPEVIPKLFKTLDKDGDSKLDLNEIKDMQINIGDGNAQKLSDKEAKLILTDIGDGSDSILKKDFEYYLLDGKLGFMIRECRKPVINNVAEYDHPCLVRKLIIFTTRRFTEYMKTILFNAMDVKSTDRILSIEDIKTTFHCSDENAKHFITYFFGGHITYPNFVLLMEWKEVKNNFEDDCFAEEPTNIDLDNRVNCMKWTLWRMIDIERYRIWDFAVPDLDFISLFEDLDTSDDGLIDQENDLLKVKDWNTELAKKFVSEVMPTTNDGKINLQGYFSYIYRPYNMMALSECQIVTPNEDKLRCYHQELHDQISSVLTKSEVGEFFRFYKPQIPKTDGDNQGTVADTMNSINKEPVITFLELEQITPKMSAEVMKNFIWELGFGDNYITEIEFSYFVKQQEPSHQFSTDDKVVPRKHFETNQLHAKLLDYFARFITGFDLEAIFGQFDANSNGLIDLEDIITAKSQITVASAIDESLLEKMAVYGNKEHVSYQEFWLFLHSKAPNSDEPRKRTLEKECAGKLEKSDEAKYHCLMNAFKKLK